MYYYFQIDSQSDFDNIRELVEGRTFSSKIFINIRKDILFEGTFKPIDASFFDVTINGNNHTLTGLRVNHIGYDRDKLDNTGMFSSVNSLEVHDLKVENSYIYGGVKCGTFAGHVENDVLLDQVTLDDVIANSEAFCGGAVGRCANLNVFNCDFNVSVYGHDVVGGVAGMANKFTEENNNIDAKGISIGKAIGNETGYCEIRLKRNHNN